MSSDETTPRRRLDATTGVAGAFATTRWTLVLRSRGDSTEARAALAELCEAYWRPVFEFLRRRLGKEEEAREATQEFFARVLARGNLDRADPDRGRFRSFLLGAVKHFLSDARDRAGAAKRGGGCEFVSWDAGGEGGEGVASAVPAGDGGAGDHGFDRGWAVSVVNRALAALGREHRESGRGAVFEALKPWLLGQPPGMGQAETARGLGWTENAVRVAVHRLRRRFRELVHGEIRQTVETEAEVQEEIRYLLDVLSRG